MYFSCVPFNILIRVKHRQSNIIYFIKYVLERPMFSNNKLIVAGGFLIQNNHLLLACRKKDSCHTIIGGKVEAGEAVHAALIREIYEEVGITVLPEHMQFIQTIALKKSDKEEIISFDFLITTWSGEPFNKEPHKHNHIQWYPLEALPDSLLERHKHALNNFRSGIYYTAYGYTQK